MTDTAKISERLLQERADRLVEQNVLCCLSPLVATLAKGYGAAAIAQRHWGDGADAYKPALRDFCDLAEQAFDLAAPVDDYEEAARQAGWAWDEPAQEFRLNDRGDGFDALALLPRVDWQGLCEHDRLDPYQWEVYEHWAVTPWLAEKLQAQGEKVDTDFPIGPTVGGAPLAVWARTTTGQAIAMDPVIRGIVAALHTEG